FSFPVSLGVERLEYVLTVVPPGGSEIQKRLTIPLLRSQQKTKLILPMKGKCWVGGGHDFNEPHSVGRSQHFAYDFLGVGPNWEFVRGQGATNSDWYTWGRESYRQPMARSRTRAMMFQTTRNQGAFRKSCLQGCQNRTRQ